jgi:hypothetical protein
MNLHPYDDKERVFRYDDASRAEGLELVARFLKLSVAPRGALFDLRFFSGGIGIFDNLAIAIAADATQAARIADACGFVAADDVDHVVDISQCRHGFQPDYADGDPLWLDPSSDVNQWGVMWHSGGMLAYLAYDQG